jgi:hypothetical protein
MTKTKEDYRKWIRSRNGTIYKDNSNDKHKSKNWRINQNHIIETFIEEYDLSGFRPAFMITRNYFYNMQDRDKVVEHNNRMNNVLDDILNPRGINEYYIMHDHYIERHKDQMVRRAEKKRPVLNTITQEIEFDYSNVEIEKGGFHVHTLVSDISDDVILKPNRKIQKAIERIYGLDEIPVSLQSEGYGMTKVKTDLLEYAIRERCDFMGNSIDSLDIQPASEYAGYDGYKGWKGMVAYVCKKMYNVDNMVEVYDHKNNTILSN